MRSIFCFTFLFIIAAMYTNTQAAANFSGSDDFNDNSVDSAKWGTDFVDPVVPPHGVLREINQRLEFSNDAGIDTFTFRPWLLNSGSYVEDWEVRTDVHLGELTLPNESHLDVGFYVYRSVGMCTGMQIPANVFGLTLDQYRFGASERAIYTSALLDCAEVERGAEISTLSNDASLRITFDSKAKILTAWYDENGPVDGLHWIVLDSMRIDAPDNNWLMNDTSNFGVMLGCSTGAGAVPGTGQAYCDNFYAGPYNELLWPLNVGEIWQYSREDVTGASWGVTFEALETVVFASNTYFHLLQSNYRPGETEHMYVRSTANNIYMWDADSSTESAPFRLGQTGETWTTGDDVTVNLGVEATTVPYGGPYNAYVFRNKNVAENSPYWFEYIVPGVGLIKEVDYWTDNAPKIQSLVSIVTWTPTPPSTAIPAASRYHAIDLFSFSQQWRKDQVAGGWDLNADSSVDAQDLFILIAGWKKTAPLNEITILLTNLPVGAKPLVMVEIPAGSFLMGRYPGEPGSNPYGDPQHQVDIGYKFYMGKYEITKAQWQAVMNATPPWQGQPNVLEHQDSPAVYISWDDCHTFVAEMNKLGQGTFRLPSEAEWEYVCRAGTTTRFYWGEDLSYSEIGDYGWYNFNTLDINEEYAHVVGLKLPNSWGLYDMAGNVFELCEDDWHNDYSGLYRPDNGSAWIYTPRSGNQVIRGGCWTYYHDSGRSAFRNNNSAQIGDDDIGLRIVREAP
jgi:formylglycine-generating enzyme required for sulfatase activity